KECNNIFFLEIGSESKWQPSNRNFLRIPYVNDESLLAQYYSSSDIFLFTSIAENCPLTVLEAMGSGLPVIAFDVGGTGELIQDTKTGYLVKTGDAEKMIGKLKLLIRNEKLLKENGRRARKRVEKYFTLKKQAQSFIDLYKDLLK
ncbi:MAG: glycosyltransferase, partial [Patescibacteria group bacterium]